MGEWIEINKLIELNDGVGVSPFMGEWIEIPYQSFSASFPVSHPSWVSGLK